MPSSKAQFECNDLRLIGNDIVVRRGPFGSVNSKCGQRLIKYSKANWTFEKTTKTCPVNGTTVWLMKQV